MEDIRKCKNAWQAWTVVDFGPKSSVQDGRAEGGGSLRRTAPAWDLAQFGREFFCPVEAAGGYKTVAGAYFCGRGACIQYDPKVIVGAKTLDPKGDAYSGS